MKYGLTDRELCSNKYVEYEIKIIFFHYVNLQRTQDANYDPRLNRGRWAEGKQCVLGAKLCIFRAYVPNMNLYN